VGLTCRIGRAVYGTIEIINDFVETGKSILIMGRPGIGKTTMLREAARVLADEHGKRVVVVDTSNEIAGDGDIPHPAIGKARRMQVRTPSLQHEVMIEAVENHMPQVIVIDEIGTELEAQAARTIAERGVQLIGTAHGNNLDNLMLNPTLSDLIGGIQSVTLGDEEARRRRTQKSVLERKAPPTVRRDHRDPGPRAGHRPQRRGRHGRCAAPRGSGRAGAPLARRGRGPSLAGPAPPVAARADRRGALCRPGRVRPAVADGAGLARRGLVSRRVSRHRGGRSAAPVRLPARGERRLAADPQRHVPRAGPPRLPDRQRSTRRRHPGRAIRDPRRPDGPAPDSTMRGS
jgi:nucleoside-triphosphatase THEP1